MVNANTIILPTLGVCLYFGTHFAVRKFLSFYYGQQLNASGRYKVSTRTVSLLNAAIAVMIAIRTMLICPDILRDQDPFIRLFIKVGVSYFTYDLCVMYMGGRMKELECSSDDKTEAPPLAASVLAFIYREFTIVIHHVVLTMIGVAMVLLVRSGVGDFFIGCIFFAELSTPFLSLRAILHEFNIYDGRLYTVNGLLFISTFFFARVMCMPYLYWKFSWYRNIGLFDVPSTIPLHCNVFSVLFMLLQLHWFSVILRTVAKRLPPFSIGKYGRIIVKFNKSLKKDENYIKMN